MVSQSTKLDPDEIRLLARLLLSLATAFDDMLVESKDELALRPMGERRRPYRPFKPTRRQIMLLYGTLLRGRSLPRDLVPAFLGLRNRNLESTADRAIAAGLMVLDGNQVLHLTEDGRIYGRAFEDRAASYLGDPRRWLPDRNARADMARALLILARVVGDESEPLGAPIE